MESVEVGTSEGCIDRTMRIGAGQIAKDACEAKESIPAAAIGLIKRAGGISEFADSVVQDPRTIELIKKVTLHKDPNITKGRYDSPMRTLKVRLKDGSEYVETVDASIAGLENFSGPTFKMSDEEVYAKYRDNAGQVLTEEKGEQLFRLIAKLDSINDVSMITSDITG